MLTASQIAALSLLSEQLLDPIVEFLLKDISQRVSEAGQLTSTAAYQIWRTQNLGVSQRKIKEEIAKRLKVSLEEAEKLLTQAAEVGYNFDIDRLPTSHAIPLVANSSLQQVLDATVKLAKEDLTNITQTIGFVGHDGRCRELTQAYNQACDFAFQKVTTGAQDYISATRDATRELVNKGIRTIDYESGVHTSVEAAARRNIMGGLGLMQEQISQKNHDLLGCDGWEISAHAGSAPDHEPIQGKQYSDEEYTSLNNSLVRRIGTLNCGHAASPIILGVNSPQYTEEELEKFRKDNEEGVTIDGRHYTQYEATQRQRKIERAIRKQKNKILVDEGLGDKDKLQTDQIRYRVLEQEYKRFSMAAGLRVQHERLEMSGFGPKQAKMASDASKKQPANGTANKNQSRIGNNITQNKEISIQSGKQAEKALVATNTPTKTDAFIAGCIDSTQEWLDKATPNSHEIEYITEFFQDGKKFVVDGDSVILDPSEREKKTAQLLRETLGGKIQFIPRVNKPEGIRTPDCLFRNERCDFKALDNASSKNAVYNRLNSAQEQADHFVIDISNSKLGREEMLRQAKAVFNSYHARGIKVIIVEENGKIIRIYERNK